MTTMPSPVPTRVTGGVDAHADVHVAVANDAFGRRLDATSVPTTPDGDRALLGWAGRLGEIDAWGIEGTGAVGAGLTRFLRGHGQVVVEVNRPDRPARRRRGKSDPLDAEAAARAVQAREGSVPKAGDGQVEMIRSLRVARARAIKARSQAVNAPRGAGGHRARRPPRAAAWAVDGAADPDHGHAGARPDHHPAGGHAGLRTLAHRDQALSVELGVLDAELDRLTAAAAPRLLARVGIGSDSAGALLVAAGDNPERLRSDAALAMLGSEEHRGRILR